MAKRKIIVGVTGGVAAYKAAMLVSQLVQNDFEVQVVRSAKATEFVGDATFAALSGRPVVSEIFDPAFPLGPHIELSRSHDLLCIAPATANLIGKLAGGLADDLLSTLYLCFTGPVILAPAMNNEMWQSPAVVRNVETLRQDGVNIVGPIEGWLSCRIKGVGRMSEPDDIFKLVQELAK